MDLQRTVVFDLAVAADVTAVGASLDAAKVRLFTNDVLPVSTSVVGNFDQTTYTGHADKAITWNAPSVADDGTVEVVGIVPEFRPTDGVTPNVVFGALVLSAGGDLLLGGRFDDAPLPMQSAVDALTVSIRFRPATQSLAIVIS